MCVRTYMVLRSLRKTSRLLGASKSTIQRWIRHNPILRKQRSARKVTAEAVKRIVDVLASNPFDTPASIASRIRDELGLCLSNSSVRFWIRRSGMSRKKASRPVHTTEVHDKRVAFAANYSAVYDPDRVVSIDESSFYFDMKPSYGYCHRSRRLRVSSRPGGRVRWSLLMAVSNERVIGWRLEKGSINSDIFAEFMSTLNSARLPRGVMGIHGDVGARQGDVMGRVMWIAVGLPCMFHPWKLHGCRHASVMRSPCDPP